MPELFPVPDGLDELAAEMPFIVDVIARTTRWVHPDVFRALPVWYPETARRLPIFDAGWQRVYTNTSRATASVRAKAEGNGMAARALIAALGTRRTAHWTVCHIWGVDDPRFQKTNRVVSDRSYYSCVANMVWLPTPLKGFTDAVPDVKRMLRTCAFHLYGWTCEHDDVAEEARRVRAGPPPDIYPSSWPTADRKVLPPGTAPFSARVANSIARRKRDLRAMMGDESMSQFPRDAVREVLAFWKMDLRDDGDGDDREIT
jgi:hypothetical protein